jgi:hypothetical protein
MVIKPRSMIWAGHVALMGEVKYEYKTFVGKLEGKKPVGRHRRRWKDNIRKNLRGIGWEVTDWIHLAQDSDQ